MLGVARGTDFDKQIKSPEVLTLYKLPGSFIPGSLPKPLNAKTLYRTADKGVLVDLSGPVQEYSKMTYTPEAIDITRAHALLDKLQSAASGSGHFAAEAPIIFKDETERLLREAQHERDLAKVAEHETLMLNEGLSPQEIAQLTDTERARLARKYASPKITELTKALAAQVAAQSAAKNIAHNASVTTGSAAATPVKQTTGSATATPVKTNTGGATGGGGGAAGEEDSARKGKAAAKLFLAHNTKVGDPLIFPNGKPEPKEDWRTAKGAEQKKRYFEEWRQS